MVVGVTGHQELDDPRGWQRVREDISTALADEPAANIGLTSLAEGADQVFAEELLRMNRQVVAVLPFAHYRSHLKETSLPTFDRLLQRCMKVIMLDAVDDIEASYMKAGTYIVDHSDVVVAVWDGRPSAGLGGTGDVVAYARERGKRLVHIDASPWRVSR